MMPRAKPRRGSGSNAADGSWSTVWERPVLFCDDAARIRELQVIMLLVSGQVCTVNNRLITLGYLSVPPRMGQLHVCLT